MRGRWRLPTTTQRWHRPAIRHLRRQMRRHRLRWQAPTPVCPARPAAARTGLRVTFDDQTQEVMAGDKVFHL